MVNFTLPMASSSDAVKPRQLHEASRGARGLTRVEGWLKGCKSVVLKHVQERLWGIQLACGLWFREPRWAYGLSGVIETEEKDLCILVKEACWSMV